MKLKVRLSKTVFGIFHFHVRFVFIKVLNFCSTKCMDFSTLKRHNSFQNQNNEKSTHNFAPRPLIFKLQQEVLKFNICVSRSSPKTDLVTNFLNLENRILRTSVFLNSNF